MYPIIYEKDEAKRNHPSNFESRNHVFSVIHDSAARIE
jgi:hypothetical protein